MAVPLFDQELFFGGDGITAGVPNSVLFPPHTQGQNIETTMYVIWGHGTSAGKLTIETSPVLTYAGTWAPIGNTIDWAAEDTVKYAAVTGVFKYMRIRISTTVVGGTIRVFIVGAASAYHQ